MSFVRGPNPIWYEFNTVGALFDDTYYAFFLTNTLPYTPQAVYQDPNGISPWSDPIEFQASGGLPNNLYFNPDLVYRIEFRQGPDQTYPLIGNPIENYIAGNNAVQPSVLAIETASNMITNPQFADINFISPITITVAGAYNIAPGWLIFLSGSGSTTITQGTNDGVSHIEGNPAYYLTFTSSGWMSASLVQTFSNNGSIFGGGGVAVAFTALATGSNVTLNINYVPSTGSPTLLFPQGIVPITTGAFNLYSGSANLVASTNTDTGTSAYVNIQITLPTSGTVALSNIQIVGQSTPLPSNPTLPLYAEETYERMVDQEFHLYKQPLSYKPIPSYLIGWDFVLNPAQINGTNIAAQAVGANKSYYAWDQTILFQSANSGITVSEDAIGSLILTAAANTKIAVIQYLNQVQAKKLLENDMSVYMSAISSHSGGLSFTISLWYTTDGSLPSTVGSNNSLVATLDANGKPATFNGNWTEVTLKNPQEATGIIPGIAFTNFMFNNWLGNNGSATTATFFAIVIGTAQLTVADTFTINKVSLCAGDIATPPAPQTQDEVLRQCQYYYERSYPLATATGTSTLNNVKYAKMTAVNLGAGTTNVYLSSFQLDFSQTKYIAPTMTFYSSDGTINKIYIAINTDGTFNNAHDIGIGDWTYTISLDRVFAMASDTHTVISTRGAGSTQGDEGVALYHYIADARLGQ